MLQWIGLAFLYGPLAMASLCNSMRSLKLPYTTISVAQQVAAGKFMPAPSDIGQAEEHGPFRISHEEAKELPPFCRVVAEISPVPGSRIRIEVWLPVSNWNGRFVAVGNGGWSGALPYGAMAQALSHDFATAATNTGHDGRSDDASFAVGHREKLTDFGYRSVHELTLKGKAITAAFYGNAARHSYWTGCSAGGKQGLMEAQRYPGDYDGIVAGAPANNWTRTMFGLVAETVRADPARHLSEQKLALLHQNVLTSCDALDGVRDGVIEDPASCRVNLESLVCKGADEPTCLTQPQREAAQSIYKGPVNPRTHLSIFPGLAPGSELGWSLAAESRKPFAIFDSYFRSLLFQKPNWDFRSLDLNEDVNQADENHAELLNATDPNLKSFVSRGGKVLIYHGWNDQLIAPLNSVNYYKAVLNKMGSHTSQSVRLFMVPGMGHCTGGDGPFLFDPVGPLVNWVESGTTPDRVIASHPSGRTRPLCPYPQLAKYEGTGSTEEAKNFVCSAPGS